MALNPALQKMVADAKARYADREAANDDEFNDMHSTVMAQLMMLGLRKATKRELQEIVTGAMAAGA